MVTHETYKSAEGQWLSPDDVEMRDGQLVEIATGAPASAGRVEKMSKSKKTVIDPSPILDQYGAHAVPWFMLSDIPPTRSPPCAVAGIYAAWRSPPPVRR